MNATRIIFQPWDVHAQPWPDDVLTSDETAEFDDGWVHVVRHSSFAADRVRSYPAHVVARVDHAQAST